MMSDDRAGGPSFHFPRQFISSIFTKIAQSAVRGGRKRETSAMSIFLRRAEFFYGYRGTTGWSNASITYHRNWRRKQIDEYVGYSG